MKEMIERVAKAIWEKSPVWKKGNGARAWELYREEARAAIEAMREPTGDMRAARFRARGRGGQAEHEAMIDAALQEPTS